MRVLKSLCRFKMCADVKDSLVVKSPYPVCIDLRLKQVFVFFRPPEVFESTFA